MTQWHGIFTYTYTIRISLHVFMKNIRLELNSSIYVLSNASHLSLPPTHPCQYRSLLKHLKDCRSVWHALWWSLLHPPEDKIKERQIYPVGKNDCKLSPIYIILDSLIWNIIHKVKIENHTLYSMKWYILSILVLIVMIIIYFDAVIDAKPLQPHIESMDCRVHGHDFQ